MWNMKRLTLKQLLAMLIAFSLIMMILVQIFYYLRFHSLTQERARNYAANLMNQVNGQLITTARSIEKGASTIAYNRHVQEYLVTNDPTRKLIELYPFVLDVLEYVKSSDDNVYDILLTDGEGKLITSVDSYKNNIFMELVEKYRFTERQFKMITHTAAIKDTDDMFYYYAYILPIFSATPKVGLFDKIGTCIVVCKTTSLEKMVLDISISKDSHFLITDRDNTIIAGNNRTDQGKTFNSIIFDKGNPNEDEQEITYDGKKTIVQYKTLASTGWKIISIIPVVDLTSDMIPIRSYGLFIGLIMALILLLIGSIFSYNITHHISQLAKFMRTIGEQNIKQRLGILAPNELSMIATDINRMLDKIEDMTRNIFTTQSKLYEAELAKKQSELAALQSQINPHFLYNTLNCISSIGLAHDIPDIVNISVAMSKIFRYSIKGADIVLIKDELDCIKDYLSILTIRYKGKFSINLEVDERLLEMKTIKMILQPIVENAIYHGIERKKGHGILMIKGSLVDCRYIQFIICDNGKGMNKKELEDLLCRIKSSYEGRDTVMEEKRSIGLVNINHRMKLLFGEDYGISFESIENEGTKVFVKLPVLD